MDKSLRFAGGFILTAVAVTAVARYWWVILAVVVIAIVAFVTWTHLCVSGPTDATDGGRAARNWTYQYDHTEDCDRICGDACVGHHVVCVEPKSVHQEHEELRILDLVPPARQRLGRVNLRQLLRKALHSSCSVIVEISSRTRRTEPIL